MIFPGVFLAPGTPHPCAYLDDLYVLESTWRYHLKRARGSTSGTLACRAAIWKKKRKRKKKRKKFFLQERRKPMTLAALAATLKKNQGAVILCRVPCTKRHFKHLEASAAFGNFFRLDIPIAAFFLKKGPVDSWLSGASHFYRVDMQAVLVRKTTCVSTHCNCHAYFYRFSTIDLFSQ